MANIQIIGNINSTSNVSRYSSDDTNLIGSQNIQESFDIYNDYIEYYVYDINGNILDVDYEYVSYKLPTGSALNPSYTPPPNSKGNITNSDIQLVSYTPDSTGSSFPTIEIDPIKDLQDLGYTSGEFKVQYNFFKNKISSPLADYFVKRISADRTEISIASTVFSNTQIEETFNSLYDEINNSPFYTNYLVNFGLNNQAVAVNIALDKVDAGYEILFKLYEPLSNDIFEKTTLWVVEEKASPYIFDINLDVLISPPAPLMLRGANFNIPVTQESNTVSTKYSDYNTLINSLQSTQSGSYRRLLNTITSKSIDINVDYTDFNNFSFFGSVETRLNNFYTKVKNIEDYTNLINKYSVSASSFPNLQLEINLYSSSINDLIANFDGYESYLYFESSSYAWPKSTSTLPYVLYSTGSATAINWYAETTNSASLYDESNVNIIYNNIPSYLVEDPDNAQYVLFLNMIGQYFDNIWILLKSITDINLSNNNLEKGASKDLVYHILKSYGITLHNSLGGDNLDLFLIGNDSGSAYYSGSLTDFSPTSSYLNNIPKRDLLAETYKRIFHNLPYLSKTKGTVTGLQTLITLFGVTSSILNVKEYGGSNGSTNLLGYNNDKVRIINNSTTGSLLSPLVSIQEPPTSSNSFLDEDLHYVDISFSPQNQINTYISQSIINSNPSWNLDEYIGDPRQIYSSSYVDLDQQRNEYFNPLVDYDLINYYNRVIADGGTFEAYSCVLSALQGLKGVGTGFTGSLLDYNGFIRLIQFFDNSLFKTLENFVPARTNLSTGVTFESPVLERNKFVYSNPSNSTTSSVQLAELTQDSGSLVQIEGLTGGIYDDLRSFTQSWSESINTPAGPVTINHTNQSEFYTGELSGTEVIVYSGSLTDPLNLSTTLANGTISGYTYSYFFPFSASVGKTYNLSFDISYFGATGGDSSLDLKAYTTVLKTYTTPLNTLQKVSVDVYVADGNYQTLYLYQNESSANSLAINNVVVTQKTGFAGEPLLNNIQDSLDSNIRNSIYTPNREFITTFNTASYLSPAELQDSYLSLTSYVRPRYDGTKITSATYNTITSSNQSYGDLAAIDKYCNYIAYFDWIGNASPELYKAGNVHITQLIDENGNIISLDGFANKNTFLVENIFKIGDTVSAYFFNPSSTNRFGSSGSYTVYDSAGYYDTIFYMRSGSNFGYEISYGILPPASVASNAQLYSSSVDNITTLREINNGSFINALLKLPKNDRGQEYDYFSYGNSSPFLNLVQSQSFNSSYAPIKYNDKIRIFPLGLEFGSTSSIERTITSATSASSTASGSITISPSITSSLWRNISGSTQAYRIYRRITHEDFVVINNIPVTSGNSSVGAGLLIPQNYNPNLDYLAIAKKAGILFQ
jgi:hypothetical protein